jgi:hypothetical protein
VRFIFKSVISFNLDVTSKAKLFSSNRIPYVKKYIMLSKLVVANKYVLYSSVLTGVLRIILETDTRNSS